MRTVYKYTVTVGLNTVSLPDKADVLCFAMQGGDPAAARIWALIDVDAETFVERAFLVMATGFLFDATGADWIGCDMTPDGSLVLHCFEVPVA